MNGWKLILVVTSAAAALAISLGAPAMADQAQGVPAPVGALFH
jgi:anti-sigma-K factor RskA